MKFDQKNSFQLKKFLKTLKLNEESISMVLGALVIVIVGILIVNYFKDKKGQTTPEALNTTQATQAVAGKSHAVVKGETLWSIAEDAYGSGYNWTDIYKENKLNKQNLEVGQVLNIPQVAAKQPTITKQAAVAVKATATPATTIVAKANVPATGSQATTYTVVKGDYLWKIAVKEYGSGYKWVEIARANKLKNPNIIHAGNVLALPR